MASLPAREHAVQATGQAQCFDSLGETIPCAGSGQDGELRPGRAWPEPRFVVSGGVARDLLTGLEWPVDASLSPWPMTWDEASGWLAQAQGVLPHGGGWRLPSRRELLSLVCLARARPALPPGHPFLNVFQHWHWTATPAASAAGPAWRVHLVGGRVFPGPANAAHMVLPVRGDGPEPPGPAEGPGEAPALARLALNGGQALDRRTGITWLAKALPEDGPVAWGEALEAARAMGGGWRLPTILELESLADLSRAWPALPPGHPFGPEIDGVWSSTSSGYDPAWAWVLYFGKGAVGVGHKPGKHFKFLLTRGV